ncbi:MAG: serine/threonine protein kinase [Lachnospiraceae bacterium]|nr:serine/threonine protein kinase [Lachnospiraceae bacterium]
MTSQATKYWILSLISSHNDSVVWLAEHKVLNIKRIIKGIRKVSPNYARLLNEAHLLKSLNHPSIPKIFDLEEDDEFTYIIEEYIPGESLKSLCNRRFLSEREILDIIIRLCNIICYLHSLPETVLYLDIKPENIIISEDNCFLVDFGNAHPKDEICGKSFGTRSYASPEQFTGGDITEHSDIFSIGRLLDFLIKHGNPTPKTAKALLKLVGRCNEKKHWNRITNVKVLISCLNEIQENTGIFSDKPVKTAFTGTAPNAGVTYLSLLFAGYLNTLGRNCLYAEINDSETWYSLPGIKEKSRVLSGLKTLSRKAYENDTFENTDIIGDYGVFTDEMSSDFYEADICCIVAGNKAWEIEEISRARALSLRCKKTVFLINLTEKADGDTAKAANSISLITVPFIADFDKILKDKEVKAVFHELAVLSGILLS